MAVIGIIRLAPGRVGYYDDITRIHLTIATPEKPIISGMNTINIKRAVKSGVLNLVSGSLDIPKAPPAAPIIPMQVEQIIPVQDPPAEPITPVELKTDVIIQESDQEVIEVATDVVLEEVTTNAIPEEAITDTETATDVESEEAVADVEETIIDAEAITDVISEEVTADAEAITDAESEHEVEETNVVEDNAAEVHDNAEVVEKHVVKSASKKKGKKK